MIKSRRCEITAPKKLSEKKEIFNSVPKDKLLLKTLRASICKADVRYYLGERPPEVLAKKYPLVPLHEGVAEIENGNGFPEGQKVIPIPNIPCYVHNKKKYPDKEHACESCRPGGIGENYCLDVKFSSSNSEGFARDYFLHPKEAVVEIPKKVPEDIAVLTEIISVLYGAIKVANIKKDQKIMVLGDGPVGYYLTAILNIFNSIPKENLFVTGVSDEHLKYFKPFSKTINILKEEFPIDVKDNVEITFECAGKNYAEVTINQAIDFLKPGGRCVLIGVSENKIPISTRKILEKNLTLTGISRSPKDFYFPALDYLKNKKFQEYLRKMFYKEKFVFDSINDIKNAFETASDIYKYGKVVIDW